MKARRYVQLGGAGLLGLMIPNFGPLLMVLVACVLAGLLWRPLVEMVADALERR